MKKEGDPFIKNGESISGEPESHSSPEDTQRIQQTITYIRSVVPALKELRKTIIQTAKEGNPYKDILKNLEDQTSNVRAEADRLLGTDLRQRWDNDPDSTVELVELASAFWDILQIPSGLDLRPGV